ncbi:hypothetical protein [Nonomuraea rhodomycinica]|uniref:Hydantoinase/oxoprolinase n=1 Tax=Nonomuraea rhodomycinica TaxID=1712872 RepID=A0A7Y6IQR5_9ACTN|nr:hypothetical protein [Nonomuraea rhodomycinica]NUW42656.1 hypothetical protein [Nonomuraea rhodomycinica]
MIVGVALARPAPVVVAVRDGALLRSATARAVTGTARAVCVAADLDTVPLAPVAAIRVGGPCPPALGPAAGLGGGAAESTEAVGQGDVAEAAVRPPAAVIVRGGHSLTGRPLAPLDLDAVRRFAAGCGLRDFAVTATGSPVLADHELAVAAAVAAEVPGARITLSYEFGRPGLRERERSAIRNAALGPGAGRLADRLAHDFPGAPLYFARSDGGLVSAHYFRRYPAACDGGHAVSLAAGRTALAGAPGEAEVSDDVVAAYGATLGRPQARVERIVQARGRAELDRALADVGDEALTRAVSAGAAPGSARITETTVNPLSYLPDGLYRVRVTAEGGPP